jgi:hypothetical protein
MKKQAFFMFLLIFSCVSYVNAQNRQAFVDGRTFGDKVKEFFSTSSAADVNNRTLFFEGSAVRPDQLEFFNTNFRMEAVGTGYTVVDRKSQAGYIFKFDVVLNPDPNDTQYILKISLIRNFDNFEILSFDFFFTYLDEMYPYNQYLFLRAVSNIPRYTEDELALIATGDASGWRNKWLYIRASFDYPVTFYQLQGKGLVGGLGVYDGPFANPVRVSPLDNKIIALPGFTIGAEGQFLDFMSGELNLQFNFGDPLDNSFLNVAAGLELKFPLKVSRFVIAPYVAFAFPMNIMPTATFADFPKAGLGGGAQFGIRGGPNGTIFIDIKYLYYLGDAVMKNPYGKLDPNPSEIYFTRSVLGLGIGYRYGFFDR